MPTRDARGGLGREGSENALLLRITRATAAIAFILGASALTAPQASANVISYYTTVYDTDWTTAGVGGLRGTGSGVINVTGVTGPVTQSYTYLGRPDGLDGPELQCLRHDQRRLRNRDEYRVLSGQLLGV